MENVIGTISEKTAQNAGISSIPGLSFVTQGP
jgi:hypothetical protein